MAGRVSGPDAFEAARNKLNMCRSVGHAFCQRSGQYAPELRRDAFMLLNAAGTSIPSSSSLMTSFKHAKTRHMISGLPAASMHVLFNPPT